MGGFLLLGYAAICVVVFKLFRVPITRWTGTTAIVAGVVFVGVLLLGMDYNHPFTTDGRIYFYTTAVAPTVQGRVTEVPVRPNVPLKGGDTLFKIGPRSYQFVVDQKKALLAEAEQAVKQLKASYDQAMASAEMAKAQFVLAEQNYNRQHELFERQVTAQAALDIAARDLESARQAMAGAEAAAERALLVYSSEINGVNTTVARLQAELGNAQLDLSNTTVVAPTDGYVTQVFLRPGMVVNMSTPAMVFIHSDPNILTATFAQNTLQRLQVGNEAEITFNGIPGRVFKGEVMEVIEAIAQGQVQASGTLLNLEERNTSAGRVATLITVADDLSTYQLPAGATAQVVVYSDHWRWVAIVRRIILRMRALLNYVA
jgi:multidrug resistance efflux pump